MTEKNSLYNNVFQGDACNLLLTWKCKYVQPFCVVRMHIMPSQMFKISTLQDIKKINDVTKVFNNDWYFFYVSLTVRLSIILVIDQLNAQNSCFMVSLFYSSTCFEHCCAHHQEVKLSSLNLCTGRPLTECDDTRCCIIQFCPPDDEHNTTRNM